ncbi:hypothetical protein NBRC111893_2588 [Lentilactobacillus kosonis]|uniref:Uncharacterized protein n=1 Tax=Lentilactobacillus kosonis TaxID=2810561 RepID=A0A401FQ08_9LACO|nr:hypothetical protein NBRC111893_2588 [Lentilactobacillus kosonis]
MVVLLGVSGVVGGVTGVSGVVGGVTGVSGVVGGVTSGIGKKILIGSESPSNGFSNSPIIV